MPDSLITQLVNEAWDDIQTKVNDGLAFGGQKTLSDVITAVPEKLPDTSWQQGSSFHMGGGCVRVRQSATAAAIFDYMYRLHLGYDSLQSPEYDKIEAWAASARQFELGDVLERLTAVATLYTCTTENLNTVAADGWGRLRCVTFAPASDEIAVPDHPASVDWDGPVKINIKSPVADIQALVFRIGGGPYVRRPADLTLGWLPGTDDGVDLVLTERLELVNVVHKTIAKIHMVE
jgi:hypothetical protein